MPTTPETLTRKMPFAPKTANDEDRTIDLVASTGAGVDRDDFEGRYREVLEISKSAIDLTALDGMPLLNAHRREGIEDVLGVVSAARVEGGQLIVTVQFSERHEAIWKDVKAGIIRNVSVGYEIQDFEDATDEATGARTRTITRWRPVETSLVPIGADAGAKSRNNSMPKPATTAALPAVTTEHTDNIATRAAQVERERVNGIYEMARSHRMDHDFARQHVDANTSLGDFGLAVLNRKALLSERDPISANLRITRDEVETRRELIVNALAHRISGGQVKLLDGAREWRKLRPLEMIRANLEAEGVKTRMMSRMEIAEAGLGMTRVGGMHTTSDFPHLLSNAGQTVLSMAYKTASPATRVVSKGTTNPDFRTRYKVQFGDTPGLEKVNEHGEFKSGTIAEAREGIALSAFGKVFSVTRQLLVNDSLGAFEQVPAKFGQLAAGHEDQENINLLVSNSGLGPTMGDGNTLFHTDHGNLASSGAVPSVNTLNAARTAMRRQTSLAGNAIAVTPKFLVVPPEIETVGEQLIAQLAAATTDEVNPFSGKLTLVVGARLADPAAWYLVADPLEIDGLEYAHLDGEEGPQIFTRVGWEIDGMEFKCRFDYGCGFLDWRGWYRNPGA